MAVASRASTSEHDLFAGALVDAAARSDRAIEKFPGDDDGHRKARTMLTTAANRCRIAAAAIADGPVTAEKPFLDARRRAVDLLLELVRQLKPLLISIFQPTQTDRWPVQDRWDEAEALHARLLYYADRITSVRPCHEHTTEVGSRAISHSRLAAQASLLADAAADIRQAVADQDLPHRTSEVDELIAIAERLERHATVLAPDDQAADELHDAFGLPSYR